MKNSTVIVLSAAQVRVNKDIEALQLDVAPGSHDLIHIKRPEQQEGVAVEDPNKALVRQVVESCRGLLAGDPTNEEHVKNADRAREVCRQMRLQVEKWHEAAKEESKFVGKALDAYKNELVRDGVKAMEDALREFMNKAANLKEQQLAAENAKLEQRFKIRYEGLIKLGMTYNGIEHRFEIGGASVTQDIIRLSDDAALKDVLIKHVMPEVNRIKAETAQKAGEAESARKALNDELERQAREQQQRVENEGFQKLEQEKQDEGVRSLRASVLEEAGARRNGLVLHVGLVNLSYPSLNAFTEEQFARKVEEVKAEAVRLRSLATGSQTASMPASEFPDFQQPVVSDQNDRQQLMSIRENLTIAMNKMNPDHFKSEIAKHDMKNMMPRLKYIVDWFNASIKDV